MLRWRRGRPRARAYTLRHILSPGEAEEPSDALPHLLACFFNRRHRFQKFAGNAASGFQYDYVAQSGSFGHQDGQFLSPKGIAADGNGNLCVADYGNARVQKFTSTGSFITAWGAPDDRPFLPYGIAVDENDNVYVTEEARKLNGRVLRFTRDGTFVSELNSSGGSSGQFKDPRAVAVGGDSWVFVLDAYLNRVQILDSRGRFVAGYFTLEGDGDGEFEGPSGIAADAAGNFYVADTLNVRVQKLAPSGSGARLAVKGGGSRRQRGGWDRNAGTVR